MLIRSMLDESVPVDACCASSGRWRQNAFGSSATDLRQVCYSYFGTYATLPRHEGDERDGRTLDQATSQAGLHCLFGVQQRLWQTVRIGGTERHRRTRRRDAGRGDPAVGREHCGAGALTGPIWWRYEGVPDEPAARGISSCSIA